jgi:hypothetical protein
MCYDFKARKVVVTAYALRSYPLRPQRVHQGINLQSWVLEVFVDGNQWVEIDQRKNNAKLTNVNVNHKFNGTERRIGQYVRPVSIGENWAGTNQLAISAFEVFGYLVE